MSQQINLFDPSLRTRRAPLDALTMLISVCVLVAALLGYHELAERQLAEAEAQRDRIAAQLKQLHTSLGQLAPAKERAPNKALLEQIAGAEITAGNWQQLLERLKGTGIGNTEGHARFLEALARQHADGVWLTSIAVSEAGDFALQGRVVRPELLSGYIQLLNREETLRGRAIGQLNIAEKKEAAAGTQTDGASKDGKASPGGRAAAVRFVEFSIGSAAKAAEAGGR
jgi:hypothetical protein